MAKQTAVQFLVMKYNQWQGVLKDRDIEEAKLIEKEQIENAHGKKINGGFRNNGDFFWDEITGEQYYNDTYENNK